MTLPSLVLLSGGLDSVAALLLACKWGADVEALFVRYGQPMTEQECEAAWIAADAVGVPLHVADIASAFQAVTGSLMASPESGRDASGRDTAFLPGRNAVLLSVAAAVALQRWPSGAHITVGFNRGDTAGFPDCRRAFVRGMEDTLQKGGSPVVLHAPWLSHTKKQIVEWVKREAPSRLPLLERSWSCYSPAGPCGKCTACLTRKAAFE